MKESIRTLLAMAGLAFVGLGFFFRDRGALLYPVYPIRFYPGGCGYCLAGQTAYSSDKGGLD